MNAYNLQWHYLIRPRNDGVGWIAMAKREPFRTQSAVYEPGDLWFAFGDTEQEARENIEAETRRMSN